MVNFKATDFQSSFKKVHETIVDSTYGRMILNRPIENSQANHQNKIRIFAKSKSVNGWVWVW